MYYRLENQTVMKLNTLRPRRLRLSAPLRAMVRETMYASTI